MDLQYPPYNSGQVGPFKPKRGSLTEKDSNENEIDCISIGDIRTVPE